MELKLTIHPACYASPFQNVSRLSKILLFQWRITDPPIIIIIFQRIHHRAYCSISQIADSGQNANGDTITI